MNPSPPIEPSTPWGPYPWEHQPQPDRPSTPWGPYPWEQNPDAPTMPAPPGSTPSPTAPSTSPSTNSQTFDWKEFLAWLGALVVLWLILTVMAEAGNQRLAYAIAGLLLFGALVFMGPTAIANAKQLVE